MRILAALLFVLATCQAQAQVTITPPAPTSANVVLVSVFLVSDQLQSQSYSVSGSTVTITIANNGPNFLPNPSGFAFIYVGPLPAGSYNFVIDFVGDANHFATVPVVVSRGPDPASLPTLSSTALALAAILILLTAFFALRHRH